MTNSLVADSMFVTSPRRLYYNPALDPILAAGELDEDDIAAILADDHDEDEDDVIGYNDDGELLDVLATDPDTPPNLVSSLCADGLHRPLLDIDRPFGTVDLHRLQQDIGIGFNTPMIPVRSASGNTHVYVPTVPVPWRAYEQSLRSLVETGWLTEHYVDHSVRRQQTLLRVPGVPKRLRDAIRAMQAQPATTTCRNCDAPTPTGTTIYCSLSCAESDRHPAPRDDARPVTYVTLGGIEFPVVSATLRNNDRTVITTAGGRDVEVNSDGTVAGWLGHDVPRLAPWGSTIERLAP